MEIRMAKEAAAKAEKCTSQNRDVYRLAFMEGAEWIIAELLPTPLRVRRNADGKLTEEFREFLCNLPCNQGIMFIEPHDRKLCFLDPEIHGINNFATLDDITEIKDIYLTYIC